MAFGGPARKFFYAADDPRVQAASAAQTRVDRIAAEARRATAPVVPISAPRAAPKLAASSDPLEQRLAEELAYARRLLDSMGDTLSGDMAVLSRHQRALQGFDIVGQILDGIASVVGARDKADAVRQLGMEDLRNRLRRTGLDGAPVPRTGAELEWGAEWMCEAGAKGC